jgi:hypothetical protein
MCYELITYNGIEYCSCNFGTWYFQGKVVKNDMLCPFYVSCHINIHLDTLVLSTMSNVNICFPEQFFLDWIVSTTKNIPNWATEIFWSSPQKNFNHCPKYFNYLIDDGWISTIGLLIKKIQLLHQKNLITSHRFLVDVGLWQLSVILVITRFRVTKQCKYQSP